jgi:uncharacterized protein (TIGR00269 family)
MNCSFCKREAVTRIPYNGTYLCDIHFNKFFQKRVNLEFRKELEIKGPIKLGVGLSGGKDSSVALFETKRIFGRRKDVEIVAITVDEGIETYRPKTIAAAKKLTEKLGIRHVIVQVEDRYATTMDKISMNGELAPCSYCGVFRRKLLNDVALEEGVDYMVTGLNLDDTAQSIIMNFARGDASRMGRMGPHFRSKEGLIPRLQPLRRIPEKEALLYAILEDIPFSHDTCPYADRAIRNEFRESIDLWEERTPGTKFSIVNLFDKIKDAIPTTDGQQMGKCRICGAPTSGEICKSCQFKMELGIRI